MIWMEKIFVESGNLDFSVCFDFVLDFPGFFFRVRVELARERRDRDRGDRRGGRGGDRFGDRRGGGDRRDFGDRRGGGDRGGRPRGAPPGRKTEYRLIVENMSSKTSWQVNYGDPKWPAIPTFLQNLLQKFNHYYCNAGT